MDYTREELQQLLFIMPGTTIIFLGTSKDHINIEYFTEDLPSYFGMTRKEFSELCKENAYAMVYPDDLAIVQEETDRLFHHHEFHLSFRRQHEIKGFAWTQMDIKNIGTCEGQDVLISSFSSYSDSLG